MINKINNNSELKQTIMQKIHQSANPTQELFQYLYSRFGSLYSEDEIKKAVQYFLSDYTAIIL